MKDAAELCRGLLRKGKSDRIARKPHVQPGPRQGPTETRKDPSPTALRSPLSPRERAIIEVRKERTKKTTTLSEGRGWPRDEVG
jgi:hypothetical protein